MMSEKTDEILEQALHQRRHLGGKQAHRKTLYISSHERHANENHNEQNHTLREWLQREEKKTKLKTTPADRDKL